MPLLRMRRMHTRAVDGREDTRRTMQGVCVKSVTLLLLWIFHSAFSQNQGQVGPAYLTNAFDVFFIFVFVFFSSFCCCCIVLMRLSRLSELRSCSFFLIFCYVPSEECTLLDFWTLRLIFQCQIRLILRTHLCNFRSNC